MKIFPAIDLYEGKAVRLVKGDYAQMTVYSTDPPEVARRFAACGAEFLHTVDLEGAKSGATPNFDIIARLASASGLKVEAGGGVRDEDAIKRYLDAGVFRVILGTAAITSPGFVEAMTARYGEAVAVGVDVKNGRVAIKGWTEESDETCFGFCRRMQDAGVKTIICTDISRDGLLSGTNLQLYKKLSEELSLDIVASGGVSSLSDVAALRDMGLYGAILGKVLYTGGLDLKTAIREAGA